MTRLEQKPWCEKCAIYSSREERYFRRISSL